MTSDSNGSVDRQVRRLEKARARQLERERRRAARHDVSCNPTRARLEQEAEAARSGIARLVAHRQGRP
jgi:predicted RNA-binding protein with RPS1 domain